MWLDESIETESIADLSQVGMTMERLLERRSLIGASDISIIMGVSPYQTPYNLWLDKTNKTPLEQTTNFAIERGIRWEDRARQRFEQKTSMEFPPENIIHPDNPVHSASLDGYNKKYNEGLEIKVTSEKNIKEVRAGRVPELYYPQVQWQIYVANLKKNNFYCVQVKANENGEEEIVEEASLVVKRDDEYIEKMVNAAQAFWTFVTSDQSPPLTDMDTKELRDHNARKDFSDLKHIKKKMDEIKQELKGYESAFKEIQKKCLAHDDHATLVCEGVKLQRIIRKGNVDQTKMSEDDKEYFNKYRKPDSISYRVTLVKEDI